MVTILTLRLNDDKFGFPSLYAPMLIRVRVSARVRAWVRARVRFRARVRV
jgi:hypothetical protein